MNMEKSTPSPFFFFLNRFLSGRVKRKSFLAIIFLSFQLLAVSSFAQYAKLLDFGAKGKYPDGSLISDGTFLYGMTSSGGASSYGTIFKIKPDGTGFSKLLDFDGTNNGSYPYGSLFSDGTFLYGMTEAGGANNLGTIFKIKPDGTGYVKLFDFDGTANGSNPDGSLISDGTFLYGMTGSGGLSDYGTIFKIKTDGTGFTKLHDFDFNDGINPYGSLILEGGFLYGMTSAGGLDASGGTIFKIKPDGTGFLKLLDVGGSFGANPKSSLVSDGTFFYGMTSKGGSSNLGSLFKIKPDGTGATKILDFTGLVNGSNPSSDLFFDGTFLYGLTNSGGANDFGTIFKIKTDGTGYISLLDLDAAPNGSYPYGSVISDGTFLYGLMDSGGTSDFGTVFKIKKDGSGFVKLLDFDVTGTGPTGSLVSDGTFLYGMTSNGGERNRGTLFKILPDGTSYSKLYDFLGFEFLDGSYPLGSLFFDGTFLYGMTSLGGANNFGTIFKIKPDGSGYSILLNFDGSNGEAPYGSLTSLDGIFLYGMTSNGGNDSGVIFKIKTDGTGYVKLSDFNTPGAGGNPRGDILLDGISLYGMTKDGGASGLGTIFKLNSDGTGYTNLLDFSGTNGANPFGSLISDGTFLYGMTSGQGVPGGRGSVFKIKPDGTGFAQLLDFKTSVSRGLPYGSLTYDGTFLYGMTSDDELSLGSIFKVMPDGAGYAELFDFNGVGRLPRGSLLRIGTTLYGMTSSGGTDGSGTVFKYSLSGGATIAITKQPSDYSACVGDVSTFSTIATGTTNIAYQWQFSSTLAGTYADIANGGGYSNVATGLLAINTTGNFGAGFYRCRMSGDLATNVFTNSSQLTIKTTGCTIPIITAKSLATQIGGIITLDLVPLIKTANNNLDLASLGVVSPPASGGKASINSSGVLTIDYTGLNFSGAESIIIKACDLSNNCAQQNFSIEVSDTPPSNEIIVYNAISPDGKNPILHIGSIEGLPSTVSIYNRWGDEVFSISDYDNKTRVFAGLTNGGNKLPAGTYFYKIVLPSASKTMTGFLSLKY
jgi:uncharacterized repeat protein (TIGR03803 family)